MFVRTNTMGVIKAKPEANSLQKITSGEFDTALVVGDDVLAHLPGPAAKALAKTQIVYVGAPGGWTDLKAKVSIHTTDPILVGSESMTRVDMNKIEFKRWKASKEDSVTSNVLLKLNELVRKKKA